MFSSKNNFAKKFSGSSSAQEPVKLMDHIKQRKQKKMRVLNNDQTQERINITGSYNQISSVLR